MRRTTITRGLGAEAGTLLRFASVGVAATLVHLAVGLGLSEGAGVPAQVANLGGFLTAFGVSYFGHYHVTFRSRRAHRTSLRRFAVVAVTGYLGTVAVLASLEGVPALPEALRLVLAVGVFPVVSYVVNRFWVY